MFKLRRVGVLRALLLVRLPEFHFGSPRGHSDLHEILVVHHIGTLINALLSKMNVTFLHTRVLVPAETGARPLLTLNR